MSDDGSPETRIQFTAADYLLLFPSFPTLPPSMSGAPAPVDAAAELRAASPLSPADVDDALRSFPALRGLTALQLRASRLARFYPAVNGALFFVCLAACLALELAILAWASLGQVYLASYRAQLFAAARRPAGTPELSHLAIAGLVRSLQGSSLGLCTLLEHVADDPRCPCPRPSCAGGLPGRAAALRVLEIVFKAAILLFYLLNIVWTPVITFASSFWTSIYGPILFAALALLLIPYLFIPTFGRFNGNIALFQLSQRLERRAVTLALADMLVRHRRALSSPSFTHPDPDAGKPASVREAYIDLHAALTGVWSTRIDHYNFSRAVLITTVNATLGLLLAAAIAGCIPLSHLSSLLYLALLALTDLLNLAASNDGIAGVLEAYHDARREIREAVVLHPCAPRSAVRAIEEHDRVLGAYLEADRYRARMFGFVVSYGAARGLLVAVATVAVGLWGILRGLGVGVSMGAICLG
ncbi:hypothetical protein DFJ74DRAFT_772342 [Hyaloraphidium curvatum]|nr:hypothetical protein DFJ74DRAFT_772342 [Hyaloraphidium curvatum]